MMRTESLNVSCSSFKFPFGGLLFIVFLIVMAAIVSHALTKHYEDSIVAQYCLDNHPELKLTVVKPDNNNRKVELCLIPGENGFTGMAIRVMEKIDGKYEELTKYVNWDIKTIEGLIAYAESEACNWGWFSFIGYLIKTVIG
jgi:hypothetical protein